MPSLSAAKPSVSITFDKPRDIRFTWSAACRYEEAFGKSIPESMKLGVGVRVITYLAWAGMLHAEPSLTIKDTERRIQAHINGGGDVDKLAENLMRALMNSGVLGPVKAVDPDSAEAEGNEQASTENQ